MITMQKSGEDVSASYKYILVSACRNESKYIDGLIDAIVAQTVRPALWVIVDDGSTDDTYERAKARSIEHGYIRIVQMPGGRPRSFSSQVYAAQHGWGEAKSVQHSFVGFLDADIRVKPHYYEKLLAFMHEEKTMGLCGGAVIDQHEGYRDYLRKGSERTHVPGGVQFFRRECFEAIGGYVAIDGGGQDTIADVMSLMKGWQIRVVASLEAIHLRPDGFSKDGVLARGMKWGRKFYLLGYHPFFFFAQCMRRLGRSPVVIGSACQFFGYVVAALRGESRPVDDEFVRFHRKMQFRRMLGRG